MKEKIVNFMGNPFIGIPTVLGVAIALFIIFLGAMGWFNSAAEWVVAMATLLLASATYASVLTSLDKEKRYLKDQRDREDRDRKERLLDEIKDWANNLNLTITTNTTEPMLRLSGDSIEYAHFSSVCLKQYELLSTEINNWQYISALAKVCSMKLEKPLSDLLPILNDLREKLFDEFKLCGAAKKSLTQGENQVQEKVGDLYLEIVNLEHKTSPSLRDILIEVAKTKLALLEE